MVFSGLAIAGVLTASSIWGFHTTHKCRDYLGQTASAGEDGQSPP